MFNGLNPRCWLILTLLAFAGCEPAQTVVEQAPGPAVEKRAAEPIATQPAKPSTTATVEPTTVQPVDAASRRPTEPPREVASRPAKSPTASAPAKPVLDPAPAATAKPVDPAPQAAGPGLPTTAMPNPPVAESREPVTAAPSSQPESPLRQPASLDIAPTQAAPVVNREPPPPRAASATARPEREPTETTPGVRGVPMNPLRAGAPATAPGAIPAMPAENRPAEARPVVVPAAPLVAAKEPSAGEKREPGKTKTLPPLGGKHSGEKFDPIEVNGSIFVDWPKPRLALVFTGRQDGYIEPCGCAGLDRMKGGISRRYSFLQELTRNKGWTVVPMDLGGLNKSFGTQAQMKFQTMTNALRDMQYQAVGLGEGDLRMGAGLLVSETRPPAPQRNIFLAANVGLFTFDPPMVDAYRVIEAAGKKIGVTAVLGAKYVEEYRKQNQSSEILLEDPVKKLKEIVPTLKGQADFLVLLAYAPFDESRALSRQFPEFNVVVTAGGGPESPATPDTIEGSKALMIQVGEKTMNAMVLGLYDDPQQPWRYQRVPLDSRFPDSPLMKAQMASYQEQIKAVGFAGLDVKPLPHPQKTTNGRFVGSEACADCHEPSYKVWKKSGHAKAWPTLVDLKPPRNHDPECVSCHVVGWHPTRYFPYDIGFQSVEKTPKLINVGCESCHGPGESHVKAESGTAAEDVREKLRKAMVLTKEDARKHQCQSCHDLDNSPSFVFDNYWPHVEHYEHE